MSRIAVLDLDRGVLDAEALVQLLAGPGEERVAAVAVWHDQVRGEGMR